MDVLKGMKFGLGEYTKSGFIKSLNQIKSKSAFGKSKVSDTYTAAAMFIIITIMIVSIAFGFLAVPRLAPGNTDRAKNIRLGLYGILLLTEGRVGWIYITLWLLNVKLFE